MAKRPDEVAPLDHQIRNRCFRRTFAMMMDRNQEVQRLNEADRHIAKAERAMSKQIALLVQLEADGHNEAARELRDFETTLKAMQEQRVNILNMINQIDKGLPSRRASHNSEIEHTSRAVGLR